MHLVSKMFICTMYIYFIFIGFIIERTLPQPRNNKTKCTFCASHLTNDNIMMTEV